MGVASLPPLAHITSHLIQASHWSLTHNTGLWLAESSITLWLWSPTALWSRGQGELMRGRGKRQKKLGDGDYLFLCQSNE